jgi:hypothetical protein
LTNGTTLQGGKFGVAPTPGSSKVLDRDTMELVDCDEDRCKYGDYYDDIGWVNRAPYLAWGGYACSVNNYTSPVQKRLAIEFCAFAASKKESLYRVIPKATVLEEIANGQDPFRRSHLADVKLFERQGYETETSTKYIETILAGLDSDNAVIDNRFPTAQDIDTVLRQEIPKYLNATRFGEIPLGSDPTAFRKSTIASIERQWSEVMADYESQGTSRVSILESYQRLRGVYVPKVNYNHLGRIRAYGYTLVTVALGASLLSIVWVVRNRKTRIVYASQPIFLVLISVGAAVLSLSILPMGIDDEDSNVVTCDMACMSIPWFLVLGWTVVFSALFSKLRRINLVFNGGVGFRRVAVTEKDVLHYFAIMLGCNLALLIVWTKVSPLEWERRSKSKEESYGHCRSSDGRDSWGTIVSLVALVNGIALIAANVEAYRARQITTEFGESQYIGMSMISILQIVMVGLPIIFLVEGNPLASYFIQSTIAFTISMSILLWMYIPKIRALRNLENDKGTGRTSSRSTTGLAFRRAPVRLHSCVAVAIAVVGCSVTSCHYHQSLILLVVDHEKKTVQVNVVQSMQDLEEYKQRLGDLVVILKERGMDADALFEEAGLDANRLNSSFFTGVGGGEGGVGGGHSSRRSVDNTRNKNRLKSTNNKEVLPLETPDPPRLASGIPDTSKGDSPNNSDGNFVPVMECFNEDHFTNALAPEEISRTIMSRISDDDSDISA